MNALSDAAAKGRRNAAGYNKLAVFFLFCLFVFTGCPANASGSNGAEFPFVKDGKLYSVGQNNASAGDAVSIKSYDFMTVSDAFTQKGVSTSKKEGWVLAWNKKSQTVYHIDENKRVRSKAAVNGSLAYLDKKYVLSQTSSFDDNKGFGFTLYSIKYSWNGKKISLKQVWTGFADCFVSDCFFTNDGVCISGGNRDDTKNNAFYITAKGIHKCFSTAKNSDFLRLLNTGDKVYTILSGRDKTRVEPLIFNFTLDNYIEGTDSQAFTNLFSDSAFPQTFDCFFGYGFVYGVSEHFEYGVPEPVEGNKLLILPASFEGIISFVCYDYKNGQVSAIVPDAVGCVAALGSTADGQLYVARDALIEDSWYGISLFDGISCKKIQKIY